MVTLLMFLAVSACSATADEGKPLAFDLVDNAIVIPVTVSGHGPFRFLLDTGATSSVVSERLLDRLGLSPTSSTRMLTPVGESHHPVVHLELELRAGKPRRVAATVLTSDALAAAGTRVDGIVGQDVLSELVYTIDYARRTMIWTADGSAAPDLRLPLALAAGRLRVSIAQPGLSEPLEMIPDSGSDAVVLFARRNRVLPAHTPGGVGLLRAVTGHRLVRRVRLTDLHIGTVRLRDHDAILLDASNRGLVDPHAGEDGLLPLHIFSRVTLNVRGGYMTVEK